MRFVTELSTDGHRSIDPTWDDVARAIESLDGTARTLVTLAPSSREGDDGIWLAVAAWADAASYT